MKKVDQKIEQLQELIKDEFVWNSTRLDRSCLTEAEKKILNHSGPMVMPNSVEGFQDYAALSEKRLYYRIRRAVDYFMREVGLQIVSFDENRIFWYLFIDFLDKTMSLINYIHGRDILAEMKFGRNQQNWPDKDDPAWKELEELELKWESDFKEYWESTNPSKEEVLNRFEDYIMKKEEDKDNRFLLETNEVLGEIITNYLARPMTFKTAYLVGLSASDKTKTLNQLLKEQIPKQKHEKITKMIIQLAK